MQVVLFALDGRRNWVKAKVNDSRRVSRELVEEDKDQDPASSAQALPVDHVATLEKHRFPLRN